MAEVMNEVGNSNGEIDEENEEIKLNGDACDDTTNLKDVSSDDDEEPSAKEKNGSKKLISSDVHEDGKIYASDKPANAVANGHFKSQSSDANSIADGEENEERTNCDNDSSDKADEPKLRADEQSDTVVENNHESTSKSDSDDCSLENSALNLKTTSNHAESDPSGGIEKELPVKDGLIESTKVSVGEERKKDQRNDAIEGDDEDDEEEVEEDDVISIYSTSDKSKKLSKKPTPLPAVSITPRRSSRNLNKQRSSYSDYDDSKKRNEDDEIEEVTPMDPLADEPKSKIRNNKTIVVSDTKGLVEFASSAKASRSNKKEPTLVIIDTNSILSGRGPIPVSQSSGSLLHSSSSSAPIPVSLPIAAGAFANAARGSNSSSTSAFSVIPIGLPAQGMYSQFKNPPPQMKPIVVGPASTTVTPVPMSTTVASTTVTAVTTTPTPKQPPVILPSLTDDMFVVEAPSFIVPYVYEKPPMKSLKEHIDKIKVDIKEAEQKEEKERQEREEKESEKSEKQIEDEVSDEKSESDVQDSSDTEKAAKEESEKSDDLQMEVDELSDSGVSVKTTSETDVASVTSKKSETEKKEEISTAVAKEVDKKLASVVDDSKKPASYFENPLGKFFMQIGLNLVQEHVQTDLLRSQKRKRDKEGNKCSPDINSAIDELTKTLESSKENNDPFKLELKKCELCSFKTESLLVMAHHLETPHMKNYTYRCNFCTMEIRSPQDILVHMEAEHNIRGRLERAPAFHQCPNCPFEDNQKGKLTRHLISCSKKYRPERNQEPPLDWEPPAKIPRVTRNRPPSMSPGNAVYQAAMSGLKQVPQNTLLPKLMPNTANMKHNMLNSNKRPNMAGNFVNRFPNANNQPNFQQRPISVQTSNQGMMYRPSGGSNSQTQVLLPQGYQLSGAQIYQNPSTKQQSQQGLAAAKLLNQPSISITPLPRQTSSSASGSGSSSSGNVKPGKPTTNAGGKSGFVVCEICDGYIKDLDQLRNHMQWIHKVKIHPKMIYNRPPLNCQKCQYRFFTDQGLERHLLGSHGLVTSSMQEAANKGKDGGRCPVCGRVYQWKLLNHVARDHQMGLKPAHLSYKCTVCTATFGMYKQFESHVYSAHSVVAKRAMDTSKKPPTSQSSQNDTLLKPLKINDEITIIPQPVRAAKPSNKPSNSTISASLTSSKGKNLEDELCNCACLTEDFANNAEFQQHVFEKHLKSFTIKISRIDLKCLNSIPNKENAYKLATPITMEELKQKFGLKDFNIKIKRHRVNAELTCKIPSEDEVATQYLVPELMYANDENTTGDVKTLETLFVRRMQNRFQQRKPAAKRNRKKNQNENSSGHFNNHFLGSFLENMAHDKSAPLPLEGTESRVLEKALLPNRASANLNTAPRRQVAVKKFTGVSSTAPRINFSTPIAVNTRYPTAVNFVTQLKAAQCLVNYRKQIVRVIRTETFSSTSLVVEKKNDVISLLSDSENDSDSSGVEIVETDVSKDEYILPV